MKIVRNKYHFSQNEGVDNGKTVEMVFYSILCLYNCFMHGQYTKQQKEINSDSEETRELMINRLFRQHANPQKDAGSLRPNWSKGARRVATSRTANLNRNFVRLETFEYVATDSNLRPH